MDKFQPTILYIKRHPATGKLYFGKTTGTEQYLLEEYNGSGRYWNDHLRIHGKENIETPWWCLFTDKEQIKEFALCCSELWDIVKAKDINGKKIWANEKFENGLDGGSQKGQNKGTNRSPKTEEHKKNIGEANTGKKRTQKQKDVRSASMKGKPGKSKGTKRTTEQNAAQSSRQLGIPRGPRELVTCPYCHLEGGQGNMKRYHFDNCKQNKGNCHDL